MFCYGGRFDSNIIGIWGVISGSKLTWEYKFWSLWWQIDVWSWEKSEYQVKWVVHVVCLVGCFDVMYPVVLCYGIKIPLAYWSGESELSLIFNSKSYYLQGCKWAEVGCIFGFSSCFRALFQENLSLFPLSMYLLRCCLPASRCTGTKHSHQASVLQW